MAAANGPVMSSAVVAARLQGERVGEVGERHQAFELVIAVGAAAEHAQCQIDLGGSLFDQRAVTLAMPESEPVPVGHALAPVAALLAGLGLRRGLVRQSGS